MSDVSPRDYSQPLQAWQAAVAQGLTRLGYDDYKAQNLKWPREQLQFSKIADEAYMSSIRRSKLSDDEVAEAVTDVFKKIHTAEQTAWDMLREDAKKDTSKPQTPPPSETHGAGSATELGLQSCIEFLENVISYGALTHQNDAAKAIKLLRDISPESEILKHV